MKTFRDLIAWQKAMKLAIRIYRTTRAFPREEMFGLTAQLRRCAVSIPSNIAEGHGRLTRGEWQQFLGQARGSLLEMQTQMLLSQRLGFGEPARVAGDLLRIEELGRIINGLLNSSGSRNPRKPLT